MHRLDRSNKHHITIFKRSIFVRVQGHPRVEIAGTASSSGLYMREPFYAFALIIQEIACPSFAFIKSILPFPGVDRFFLVATPEVFTLRNDLK